MPFHQRAEHAKNVQQLCHPSGRKEMALTHGSHSWLHQETEHLKDEHPKSVHHILLLKSRFGLPQVDRAPEVSGGRTCLD